MCSDNESQHFSCYPNLPRNSKNEPQIAHLGGVWKEPHYALHRRDELKPATFARRLAAARDTVMAKATKRVPPSKKAQNMAKRFRERGQAYFEFITTPNVEPTNNIAEQAIRFVVIDRRITQGTRGESGRRWCERIWTTLATCARTGRDVMDFLHQSILAHWRGEPPPSLLATASKNGSIAPP